MIWLQSYEICVKSPNNLNHFHPFLSFSSIHHNLFEYNRWVVRCECERVDAV